jgi:hypothetical protein
MVEGSGFIIWGLGVSRFWNYGSSFRVRGFEFRV